MSTKSESNSQVDVNSPRMLLAAILLHTVGPQVLYILPSFVQGLKDYGGFDEKQAGFLASAETTGIALGTIAIIFLQSRVNWRHIFTIAVLFVVAGNFASMGVSDFEAFRVTRYIAGFGAGCLLSLSYVVIALTERHDRNFGFMIMTTLIYAGALVFVLPTIYGTFGFNGLLTLVAVSCLPCFFFIKDVPKSGKVRSEIDKTAINLGWFHKLLGLGAVHAYFLAMGAVWSYLFLIGLSGGASEQSIANALSVSQIAGIAGAFAAAMLGIRYGRALPLTVTMIMVVVSVVWMLDFSSALFFTFLVCVFLFAQDMSHPYLLGSMASFDRTGKLVAYAATLTSLGYSFGSYMAASVIPGDGTYDNAIWLAVGLFATSLVFILIPTWVYAKRRNSLVAGEPVRATP